MSAELVSTEQALAYVRAAVCRYGPPELIGAELEWPTSIVGDRPTVTQFAEALGPHTPPGLRPTSSQPLGAGSRVSIEPGGQVELASDVHRSARELCDALAADHAELGRLLAMNGIEMHGGAMDLTRPPRRILEQPRYRAMEEHFARISPLGTVMMCNTAAVQVSVDCGVDEDEAAQRWALLHEAGPALAAAFADSPQLPHCFPPGEGWASQRLRTWLELDPARTCFDREWSPRDGSFLDGYARWVLAAPLLCVRRSGPDWSAPDLSFRDWIEDSVDQLPRPRIDDLDYHLTTMFPPVRACGHFEVRYLDAQPGGLWRVPIAAIDALLRSPAVLEQARGLAAGTSGRWHAAARRGLGDRGLREAATDLLELAARHAGDDGFGEDLTAAALRCKRGLRPSEEDQ
ncbi:ergothioneine biosynthesis glutamate--cysteine ligase EgtA [Tomitella biformata]|uniref:ergothioneine biosynthesis glutamate--cysteine ligase EgtA n=1 Tax=Tomitella biformata TaxID=630403 RepID=UPI000467B908|nr:ergothioneine biosynthesis glutamate--cysteine ligase EgtA [Tomitella biformata]